MVMLKRRLLSSIKQALLVLTLAFSAASYADVESLSVDIKMANGEGQKAYVKCHRDDGNRVLLKLTGTKQWCDSALSNVCSFRKHNAAKLVCSNSYAKQLGNTESEKAVVDGSKKDSSSEPSIAKPLSDSEIAALKKELISIESQRIIISEKFLVLRRKEIELSKGSLSLIQ